MLFDFYLLKYPLSMDVTLNIEVPCEDHFDMIAHTGAWCQEDSIARIMNETGVLILFPCGRVEADGLFENVNTVLFFLISTFLVQFCIGV